MKTCQPAISTLTLFCAGAVLLCGCTAVGPRSIRGGRAAYAEAINKTENEQALLSIVKGRYGESSSLLAVGGIAANMRFRANAGIEAGFGSDDVSGENLLIGGFAYEENPTITYTPVQGEEYLLQLTSPIPLDLFMMVLRSETFVDRLLTVLLNRANRLRNPDFLFPTAPDSTQEFSQFVGLFTKLRNAGVLILLKSSKENSVFEILLSNYSPDYSDDIKKFLRLLDIPTPESKDEDIVIPAYFAISGTSLKGLRITTRSIYDLVEIFRAAVEVPQEHALAGLTLTYPPMGLPGKNVHILSSRHKPGNSTLAVKYRGYWFYIDDTDHETKASFNLLRTLWSVSIAGAIGQMEAPVYTIPVSQ